MSKFLWLSVLLFCFVGARAQQPITIKKDSTGQSVVKVDSVSTVYVNRGKIAARKAAIRSAILPGLGQIKNGVTVYRVVKVAAIYTGATLLTISFMSNNKEYHKFLYELQYRSANNGASPPGSELARYTDIAGLTTALNTYRRNKEIIIFSYIGLYAVNIIEAYVDARLKYFDVGDDLAIKISPDLINPNMRYGALVPALKVSLRF